MKKQPHLWIVEQFVFGEWIYVFGHTHSTLAEAKHGLKTHKSLYTRGTFRISKYVRQP